MRIIQQSHQVIRGLPSKETLLQIEGPARECHQSAWRTCEGSAEKLVRGTIMAKRHFAMIEFAEDPVVRFVTDRGISHELVRHRLCSFSQKSTRYVDETRSDGGIEFIEPLGYRVWTLSARQEWESSMKDAEEAYFRLREQGISPQFARSVLPNSMATAIWVKANVREWRHIFSERCAPAAHPQMRALMTPVFQEFCAGCPALFEDLLPIVNRP